MSDYNEQMDIAKKVMVEDSDALSKLHNTKSIQYPYPDSKIFGIFIILSVFIPLILICIFILNPIHQKNIEKLRIKKLPAQHYILNHCDPVWFYKPDEIGWTRGEVIYVWGYHPVIYVKDQNKTFQFHEVEWTTRYE